jgi:hypothetical protein
MKPELSDLKSTCETEEIQPELSEAPRNLFPESGLHCSLRMPVVPMCSTPKSNDLLNKLSCLRQQLTRMEYDLQMLAEEAFPEEPPVQLVRHIETRLFSSRPAGGH